jgi:N-acetyltransferase 10
MGQPPSPPSPHAPCNASASADAAIRSHRKKRMNQIRKMMQRGLLDPEKEDPFSLFVASTSIRYCYYHETQNILGNTFGMCVLQASGG